MTDVTGLSEGEWNASRVLVAGGPVVDRPSIVRFVGVPAVVYPSDWVSVDAKKKGFFNI